MTDECSFWTGFAIGLITSLIGVLLWCIAYCSVVEKPNEILRIEYKNTSAGASKTMIEDMVKTHFPSNVWENADYDCSKTKVKIELSNP